MNSSEMKEDLKNWGIGLIAIGILSMILSSFLDPFWGGMLVLLGILTLIIRQRGMYIVIGIGLILAGIMNIFSFSGLWVLFGGLQIYWGIKEINKFSKVKVRKSKPKKYRTNVWENLRIGFWGMITIWAINFFLVTIDPNYENNLTFVVGLLFVALAIFVFVNSILHLNRHNEKGFAITSLVLSSILLLLILIGAMEGAYEGIYENLYDIEKCEDICYNQKGAYDYTWDGEDLEICVCLDEDYNEIYREDLTNLIISDTNAYDSDCSSNKYNCADFNTYAEAKAMFDKCGGVSNDIHYLDGDDDGIPCESLR